MKESEVPVEPTLSWRNGGAGLTLWWYEKKQKGVRMCCLVEDIPQNVSTSGTSEI
jgi:hypothetical protein